VKHGSNEELREDPQCIFLHLDTEHMGVGGIDSWGARPLPQHLVPTGPHHIELTLLPFQGESLESVSQAMAGGLVARGPY